MRKLIDQPAVVPAAPGVHHSQQHESAARQATGSARYVDDMPEPANIAYAAVGTSAVTRGTITAINLDAVKAAPGV